MLLASFLFAFMAVNAFSMPPAAFNEFMDAYGDKEYAKVLSIIKPYLAEGDATAELIMAIMYDEGQGVTKDAYKATHYYSLSAKHGNIVAHQDAGARQLRDRSCKSG